MSTDAVKLKLEQMRQAASYGTQAQAHMTISLGFSVEALLPIVEACLDEHASHFDRYQDDLEGCATCYWLARLAS